MPQLLSIVGGGKLARALGRAFAHAGVFMVGDIRTRSAHSAAEADGFIRACREDFGLSIGGLMCLPPIEEEPSLHFALLAKIARRNGLPELSMGMSGDLEKAIALGATHVRVGTAIFGTRKPVDDQTI